MWKVKNRRRGGHYHSEISSVSRLLCTHTCAQLGSYHMNHFLCCRFSVNIVREDFSTLFNILPQPVSLLHNIVPHGSTVTQLSVPLLLHI